MIIAMDFDTLYNSDVYRKIHNLASGLYFQNIQYVLFCLDKELIFEKLRSV